MYENWIFSEMKKRNQEARKKELRTIGSQVYSFFIDEAPELGFEERTGQWEMACDIVQAMIEDKHVLVEAGVGIGKTYAYIVPLMYYHKKYRKPIVIATSTIALQEQLANDLQTIQHILQYHTDILIAKGQIHFLCKDRLEDYFCTKQGTEEYVYYEVINKGGHEKSDWDIEIPDKIWNRINVSTFNPITCRQKCIHKDYCFYYQLRIDMLKTKGFILCNQDLLTMNMRKRSRYGNEMITKEFQYVVIDEAHNLESKVRNSYTTQLTYTECIKVIENVRKKNRQLGGALDQRIVRCLTLVDEVFGALQKQIKRQDELAEIKDRDIERYYVDNSIEALPDLVQMLREIYDAASMDFGLADTYRTRGDDENLEKIEDQYEFFGSLNESNSKDIFWMTSSSKGKNGIIVSKCPKNVNELTERLLFRNEDFRVIMTSATISNGGENEYNYFISNTNLPVDKTMLCDSKESPFDYDSHAIIYYTENIPHPSNEREAFIKAGVEEIVKLLELTKGKALILFTAKRDMLEVYDVLCKKISHKILMQTGNASQNDVINEFKRDVNSVLLGTGSYWEGISIEGTALSNLIIFRLPFPVPEPIIDYKRSISQNGLMEVSVPEMIIKLKQGIGRLIRNKDDFGIVSIIDPRLGDKGNAPYKKLTWDALPIKNKTNNIDEAKQFYLQCLERFGEEV